MNKVLTTGYEFNKNLIQRLNYLIHDTNTKNTSELFGDIKVEVNQRAWEVFNGELMIALRWGLALGIPYETETTDEFIPKFNHVTTGVAYKGYMVNSTLTISSVFIKLNDTKVLIAGIDVITNHGVYGIIDLKACKITTGCSLQHLNEVLGTELADNLFEYLSGNIIL